jgi:hypothetical protein
MKPTEYQLIQAARAAHEVNRIYCLSLGDHSQLPWSKAPQWAKNVEIFGAKALAQNPEQTPEQSHQNWLEYKAADGWQYGKLKDPENKRHPCMVPYRDLPESQKLKDALFQAVVRGVLDLPTPGDTDVSDPSQTKTPT